MSTTDLVTFLQERAGDYLRGVLKYDQESTDIQYLREDIRNQRIQSQFDRVVRRVRPEATAAEERAFPFGDLHVTVRRFDDAMLLHFPRGQDRGTLVALEPDAARDLNTFTTECVNRLQD